MRYEPGCSCEEHYHSTTSEELDREDTVLLRRKDLESLLQAESDEEDAGKDEQCNHSARVPGIEGAAEIDGEDAADVGTGDQDGPKVVDFTETLRH